MHLHSKKRSAVASTAVLKSTQDLQIGKYGGLERRGDRNEDIRVHDARQPFQCQACLSSSPRTSRSIFIGFTRQHLPFGSSRAAVGDSSSLMYHSLYEGTSKLSLPPHRDRSDQEPFRYPASDFLRSFISTSATISATQPGLTSSLLSISRQPLHHRTIVILVLILRYSCIFYFQHV
ncbi:hypothetical protein P154DRAFT_528229 [Amniculicola lignicola CBS 123094]|uniref:Uncharacterized protein n=1 Tax=Amniculicola lignicola CBS 123094 TaxID=1392246 RepID=A0A6A5W0R2_9PLEO|nr:hypothetical protein P154DRAFT_528229 [Amniculicola lignicola CBS 123094]